MLFRVSYTFKCLCVVVVWNLDLEAFWMIANDTKV